MTLPKTIDPASPITSIPTARQHERALIDRVLGGDRSAARALYDAHVDRVFRLAYRLTGDDDRARELTQDTFIRAFDQLARFRGDSALATWLYRVTITVASNLRRRQQRRDRELDLDAAGALATDGPPVAEPDLRDRMAAAIDALPEIYRTTFVMHDVEGYTHLEIAEALGVAEGTCKSRLFIARGLLRKALAPFVKE
ncbi:MAG TPA: RNA polymerase sigma factor [Gemmatimonadaceae bacterium]|nr:RNA polymerase sigma factor [Gemmatimonadaceae bacterium]